MAEETKEIKIDTKTKTIKPSIRKGVWLATWKDETNNLAWFKHCGPGKIN